MNHLLHIRVDLFRVSQEAMASIAGVSQATWSRWEAAKHPPKLTSVRRMRAEARKRRLPWQDRWFLDLEAA